MPGPAIAGVASLRLNGDVVTLKGSVNYSLGKVVRETQVGPNGPIGYSERGGTPFLEMELADTSELDLESLSTISDVPITLHLKNRKVIAFRNAWAAGDWGVSADEGTITARFEAMEASEVTI